MADEIIISRIQHRRGLRTNLPQPLRPGEIGFAIDTKELFIGADLTDTEAQIWNRSVQVEPILNADSIVNGFLNNRIVKLSLPVHQVTSTGSTTITWNPTVEGTFGTTKFGSVDRTTFDIRSGQPFDNEGVVVAVNDEVLDISQYTLSASSPTLHSLEFVSTAVPEVGATITITYYGREGVIHLLEADPEVSPFLPSTLNGFYTTQNVNDHRKFGQETPDDLVKFDPQTGVSFIGLVAKHVEVFAEGVPPTFPIPSPTNVEIITSSGSTGNVSVAGATSIADIIAILDPALATAGITEINLQEIDADPDNFFAVVSIDNSSFTLDGSNLSNVGLAPGTFDTLNAPIITRFENYVGATNGALDDEDVNILTNVEMGNSITGNIDTTFVSTLNALLFITFASFGQAASITDLLNRIYLETAAPPFIRSIAVVKSNIKITTELDRLANVRDIVFASPFEAELVGNTPTFTASTAEFELSTTNSIIVDYSIRLSIPPEHFLRTGTLLMNGIIEISDVSMRDDSTETSNFAPGIGEIELRAVFDDGKILIEYINTFTETAVFNYVVRRWHST